MSILHKPRCPDCQAVVTRGGFVPHPKTAAQLAVADYFGEYRFDRWWCQSCRCQKTAERVYRERVAA